MGGERLQRLDASTWEEIKVPFEYRKDAPMDIRTSPDGAFISLHYFQSGTRVMTEDFGRVVGYGQGQVAFLPGGKDVAVVRRASVAVYGLATGDEKHLFDFGASGLACASDGSELCSSDSGGLFRYSTETWRPAKDRVAHRQHSAPQEFAFSPTGNFGPSVKFAGWIAAGI